MRSGIRFGFSTLLAMALIAMIGCGGSSKSTPPAVTSSYNISGTIAGLTGAGLVLENDGSNDLTISASATTFTFTTAVPSKGVYSVTVFTQPAGESCAVTNGDGMVTANVTNVSVTCTALNTIGGTITGLTGTGLVLQDNGGDSLTVGASATSFTFPTPVASGGAYSVSILTQPLGETCAVNNGSGTAAAAVTNVTISCTSLYEVSGTITGLMGTGLVLQDNGGDNLTISAGTTGFTFPTSVAGGGAYSITILSQPASENCTVNNGSGIASANVTSASVICVGDWTWMQGSPAVGLAEGLPGIYGTRGTPAPTNLPGGREQSATWTDASGNTWLFGGYGPDSAGTGGELNDLWKFDPKLGTNGEWTWISGSTITPLGVGYGVPNGEPGVYGTLGTASPTNVPGGREQMVSWKDASGKLWLFGGIGIDTAGTYGYLNDLWVFDPQLGTSGEWTWMGGSSTTFYYAGQPGVYGTLGTAAPTNVPGGRYGAVSWTDASGNFWLWGGNGYDSAASNGYLNDLWEYTPGANGIAGNWTWMGGSNTVPPSAGPFGGESGQPGVYGTLGTAASTNVPGGRSSAVSWTDGAGNFWLFGGLGVDSAGTNGYLNDLWEYKLGASGNAGNWTWMSGSNTEGSNGGQPGVYGVQGTAVSTNVPGARFSPSIWVDASGNLWLFGGQGYDWTDTAGYLNDLWKYTPGAAGDVGQWTWMGGSDAIPPGSAFAAFTGQYGVYGTLGTPAPANSPGGRFGAAAWTDASGNLWLFGGQGFDGTGAQGNLNDLWRYQP
ncbi:MAG: hypothetical protein WBX22_17015 [Silvibacterium sp.]